VLAAPLAGAALVVYGLVLFNNYVLPETNHAFANLLIDIGRMRPTVKLQEGVFITDFPGYNMLVNTVNSRTNEMRGVTLYELHPGGPPTTIIAERGYLSYTPDGRDAVLELRDGEIHEIPAEAEGSRKYRRLVFKKHIIHIAGAGGVLERSIRTSRGDREMSARGLLDERAKVIHTYNDALASREMRLRQLEVPERDVALLAPERLPWTRQLAGLWGAIMRRPDPLESYASNMSVSRELDEWRNERRNLRRRIAAISVEVHKKFSLPAACIVFVLIGAPLGMRVRRAGPGIAFLSVAFFLFYYLCLIGGEELANRLLLPPWISMWLANMVLGAWGALWTMRACEVRWPTARRRRLAEAA